MYEKNIILYFKNSDKPFFVLKPVKQQKKCKNTIFRDVTTFTPNYPQDKIN